MQSAFRNSRRACRFSPPCPRRLRWARLCSQTRSCVFAAVQVAAVLSAHSPHLCAVASAGTGSVFVNPHVSQVKVFTPAAEQVAGVVTAPSSQSCSACKDFSLQSEPSQTSQCAFSYERNRGRRCAPQPCFRCRLRGSFRSIHSIYARKNLPKRARFWFFRNRRQCR